MNEIGARLKSLRQNAGLTQQNAADSLCITRQAISNYENNKTQPDYEMLGKLAKLYHTDISYILGEHTSDEKSASEPAVKPSEPPEQLTPNRRSAKTILLVSIPIVVILILCFCIPKIGGRNLPIETTAVTTASTAAVTTSTTAMTTAATTATTTQTTKEEVPYDACLVEEIHGRRVIYWEEDGKIVISVYMDGEKTDSITAEKPVEWNGPLLERCEYDGWFLGCLGLYHEVDGKLVQVSKRRVKDLCLTVCSDPIILVWDLDESSVGTWCPGDSILSIAEDGTERVLLSDARMKYELYIEHIYKASQTEIGFTTESDVGMGNYDRRNYILHSAENGVPISDTPQVETVWFEAGRPETEDGYTEENPFGYMEPGIEKEQKRLNELGIGI